MSIKVSDLYSCSTCINLSKSPSAGGLNAKCCSQDEGNRELFLMFWTKAAKRCNGYKCRQFEDDSDYEVEVTSNIPIELEDALDELLSGESKFILHSTKTNEDFWYRIDRKELKDNQGYIYFVHMMQDNKEIYAGNITYVKSSDTYVYRQGKNGTVANTDIRIKSLIFVLNNLNKKNYDMKLQVFKVRES